MTFPEYLAEVSRDLARHHGVWRVGQAYYNTLFAHRPDLARRIDAHHPALDPFYEDAHLTAFLAWIGGQWTDPVGCQCSACDRTAPAGRPS